MLSRNHIKLFLNFGHLAEKTKLLMESAQLAEGHKQKSQERTHPQKLRKMPAQEFAATRKDRSKAEAWVEDTQHKLDKVSKSVEDTKQGKQELRQEVNHTKEKAGVTLAVAKQLDFHVFPVGQ